MSKRKYPEKALFCVYKISFVGTDKFYIGSANNSEERIWKHVSTLRMGTHKNKILQNVFNKYGQDNIKFEILEQDLGAELRIREQYYIDTLNPYINIAKDVRGHFGMKLSEDTKKKISVKIKQLYAKGVYKDIKRGASKGCKRSVKCVDTIQKSNNNRYLEINAKRDELILQYLKEKRSKKSITKLLNISLSVIYRVMARYKIPTKSRINQRGSKNTSSKITESQVVEIKKILLERNKTHKEIGKLYNISAQAVTSINRGRSWAHILI